MLKFSYYIDNKVDKAWFDSSNIVYAECDESETAEKTVRVVFKNGSMYRYDKVNVYDWTLFKNSESQGKALNTIFKKAGYAYEKINESINLEALEEEYEFRSGNGMVINIEKVPVEGQEIGSSIVEVVGSTNLVQICDNKDKCVFEFKDDSKKTITIVQGLLEALGYKIKITNLEDNGKSE